jgi:hypothetical protein
MLPFTYAAAGVEYFIFQESILSQGFNKAKVFLEIAVK